MQIGVNPKKNGKRPRFCCGSAKVNDSYENIYLTRNDYQQLHRDHELFDDFEIRVVLTLFELVIEFFGSLVYRF